MKLATCFLAALGLILSPGKPLPIVDKNGAPVSGSISEKIWVNINGTKEGMFIKSRNPANPVLLFVEGGTGRGFARPGRNEIGAVDPGGRRGARDRPTAPIYHPLVAAEVSILPHIIQEQVDGG